MTHSILGIVPHAARAEQVVGDLHAGGFYDEEIGVLQAAGQGARDLGALIGKGVPEHEVRRYADLLREGDALVSVLVVDRGRVQLARDILDLNQARDIALVGDAPAPAAQRRA